ncbi:hypothetical protein RLOC_00001690 [Lonchura striata]|uniref:Uncharacterized protein n=1 Tax=Lonchura striata TaxID=40157 RepID=A0A218UL10_9PASE|nr:hypothetical protein RLOC_00001690 [Lonchura striata domestica]
MELEVSARGGQWIGFPRADIGVSLLSPPPHSCQDQEEQGQCEVQGALQPVPLHPGHHRQGEG